jgi:outer membrane protein with beta-barrel domain
MKKTAILIASLLLLLNASAQKTHFGIKGGVNASNLHYSYPNSNTTTNTDSKLGFNLGVLAHLHASKTWAIQPEIMYSLEGASYKTSLGTTHINLNYINVPVLLQYMFKNGFRLEGGPQIGFLISAKEKTPNVAVTNNDFEATAVSIPLGIGYLTSSGLGLDARYVFGLSNINEDKNGPVVQSNVFQLGLFYQFTDSKIHRHSGNR